MLGTRCFLIAAKTGAGMLETALCAGGQVRRQVVGKLNPLVVPAKHLARSRDLWQDFGRAR